MNIKETAKQLNISEQSLRLWEKIFDIEVPRDKKQNRIYSNDTITILEKIKDLKSNNKDTEEIKLILKNNLDSKLDIRDDIRAVIKAEILEQTEISREYAKATYRIGQLEAQLHAAEEKIKLLPDPTEMYKLESENKSVKEKLEAQNEMLKEEKERLFVTINEFDKVKEENITIKQKLSLFPEPEVFNQIKQEKEHLVNENLILQRHVQKLLDEVDYHKLSWWDKLCLKLNKNQKMVVHKVNIEAMT